MSLDHTKTMDLIDDFMGLYEEEGDQWTKLKDCAMRICKKGLQEIGVMGNVTARVKAVESLKKPNDRNIFKEYRDQASIIDDGLDFVGLRIALYFPQEKQDVIQMLKNKFYYDYMRPFDRDWKPDEPGIYQYLFGNYVADHMWVYFHEDDREGVGKYSSHKFEIQLESVLIDAWAGISHDLEYKTFSGDPTRTKLKLLDALKGYIEIGELILEQLYRVYCRRVETENELILSSRELGEILFDSVPENQISKAKMGELDTLLEVLRGMGVATPRGFRGLLRKHSINKNLGGALELFQRDFQPMPITVVFCLLEKILPDFSTERQQFCEIATAIRVSQNRVWYDSRYWQPLIWLSRELVSSSKGLNSSLTASQAYKYAQTWGVEHYVRSQTPITLDEDCVIDCLSRTSERSAPGIEFIAELCILGIAPTVPEYMQEREDGDEDDRFQIIATAMQLAYVTGPQVWARAIYNYSVLLRDSDILSTYNFFHSADVTLWLMRLGEQDIFIKLLKNWPLKSRSYIRTDDSVEAICDLAERLGNEEIIQLLNGEIKGFHSLDVRFLEGFKDDRDFKQCQEKI
jgi:ppGpp synthetase/RelA/SpoT-type nucleotidyltranferase